MLKIGIITISDRASAGIYEDKSGKEIEKFLKENITNEFEIIYKLIPDEFEIISNSLNELVDENCSLILTTGGTGPAKRDITPEATKNVIQKELPGFGELMRMHSLKYTPTAILSRQIAGTKNNSLIINLPGKPKAIKENLESIWSVIPYTIELIEGDFIDSPNAFRPKK